VTDLRTLAEAAARDGWAEASGTLQEVRSQANALGWAEMPHRRGEPAATVLHPRTQETAHPHSLSATYGLGAQPLHTDGAHLPEPPDFLVLASEQGSTTPTLLWRSRTGSAHATPPGAAFRHGMFLVRNGRDSFFSPAITHGRHRFDPGCMTACDSRAQQIVDFFRDQLGSATAHDWPPGPQLLIIDNRCSLHARAALSPGDEQRSLERVAFRVGSTP